MIIVDEPEVEKLADKHGLAIVSLCSERLTANSI
jgi:hypothetical protein